MSDILDDYRIWAGQQEERSTTHSKRCHLWPRHEACMIHRLAAALEEAMRGRRGGWIPASERLPDRRWDGFSDIVVVAAGNSFFLGRYYRSDAAEHCSRCGASTGEMWYIGSTAEPTHWMELPEPPEVK